MQQIATLDLQAIENLRALNPDDDDAFLREITTIFLEDTPVRLAELEQSLVNGDVATFARAAHSIKGSSANLGAMALRAAAEKLEHEARARGIAGLAPLVQQVKREFATAASALNEVVGK